MKNIKTLSRISAIFTSLFMINNVNCTTLEQNILEYNNSEIDDWITYSNDIHSIKKHHNLDIGEQDIESSDFLVGYNLNDNINYEVFTTEANETGMLSDKNKNEDSFTGMDRVYLQENYVNSRNILTQDMISKTNTIYIIQSDFDLNCGKITIPKECILEFEGGKLSNGTIAGNKTSIISTPNKIFGKKLILSGSWNIHEAYIEWFDENEDADKLQHALDYFFTVRLLSNYTLSKTVNVKQGRSIIGSRYVSNDIYNQLEASASFVGDAILRITGPGVKLNNFSIKGNGEGNSWHSSNPNGLVGISMYDGDNHDTRFISIERVRIVRCGVGVDLSNYYGKIEHCSFYYNNIGVRLGVSPSGIVYASCPIHNCHIRNNAIGCYFSEKVNFNDMNFNVFEYNKIHVYNDGHICINGGYLADGPKIVINGKGHTTVKDSSPVATVGDAYGESVHFDRYTMIGACANGNIYFDNCQLGVDQPLISNPKTGGYDMKAYSTIFGEGEFELHNTKLILSRMSAANLSLKNKGHIKRTSDIIPNYVINGTLSNQHQSKLIAKNKTLLEQTNLFGFNEIVLKPNTTNTFYYEIPNELVGKPMLIGVVARYNKYKSIAHGFAIAKDADTYVPIDNGEQYISSQNNQYYVFGINSYINKLNYMVVSFKKNKGVLKLYYNNGGTETEVVLSSIFVIQSELKNVKFGFIKDLKNILDRGTISQRPILESSDAGFEYYNETDQRKEYWNGKEWVKY